MPSFVRTRRFLCAYGRAMAQPVIPVVWLVTSIFGIVAGPFGTEQFPLTGLLAFWPITIGLGVLTGGLLRVIVRDYWGLRSFWPEAPLIAVLATLGLTPLFLALARAVAGPAQNVPSIMEMTSYIFIMSIITSTLRHAVAATWPGTPVTGGAVTGMPVTGTPMTAEGRAGTVPPEPAPTDPIPPRCDAAARLMARLSPGLRAPLIRLQMRDHYVEVFTEAGSETVLLRMADAICAAEGVEGLQVHRSHWVARQAILGVMRGQGKVLLALQDGTQVPVSRGNAPAVLALGLKEIPPQADNGPEAPQALAAR
ncbi:LytTR family DNA-binding domain-containing protein [Rhodobacter capsulatus]|uniref:Transcriptional regulator, AlgR/AgrA/LytR family n=1 Tax=Rhodobacter capsulatus (strain ATCC BAA-309 / NBRC 16581 / SB1003) TaxID=272942 RepID=D5ARA6_RHOCB|nr:LytTR family DNA-binding domain-containing protein [Rhodobacter capsulatus]ADE86911.1 transcriptional regulator, AlgR/AgrA/LytR family [Rhodobacter capsulatus SB 1003]MDS0928711.1 LytTR family transcriptional regulator [Rhodobacter capsulatus]TQD35787.1 LytTR family transcriptional regulator [Rhodobacter capsulatus]